MYKTEQEIHEQHVALQQTKAWFAQNRSSLAAFFAANPAQRFVMLGSGSGYMLAKSAAAAFSLQNGSVGYAVSGGDFMLDPEKYKDLCTGAIVIALSRSGLTTEMVRSVEHIKKHFSAKVLAVTAKEGADLNGLADYGICLPWAYDQSVCQTRTVTNLYAAVLYLAAIRFDKDSLWTDLCSVIDANQAFRQGIAPVTDTLASLDFSDVVVLADSPVAGIAEEAALAFTEISKISGKQFNVLDFRHGPIVLCSNKTLVLALLRSGENFYQKEMVRDLKARGCILCVAAQDPAQYPDVYQVVLPPVKNHAANGIDFINLAQLIALKKALNSGINPDVPAGLDAYISLKEPVTQA